MIGGPLTSCTVVARNYLAHARVLARSIERHHPGSRTCVLVLDDVEREVGRSAEPFEVLHPADIGLRDADFAEMAAMYSVLELATAVKPWLLLHLLDSATVVVYLDPDILVTAPLDDVVELGRDGAIVLTPHTLAPIPRDGLLPGELDILRSGTYNLGFLAVSRKSRNFLVWWQERLRTDCVVQLEQGLFVDQRWMDFAPSYFDVAILRDPTLNVAYWNLHERPLALSGDCYEVDGRPLRFFHFSGFDPDTPHLLSKHMGKRPRVLLSEHPAVAAVTQEYADLLRGEDYAAAVGMRYGLDVAANGLALDHRTRRLYRQLVLEANAGNDETKRPPNPFSADGAGELVRQLASAAPDGPHPRVSRYLAAVRAERLDLQHAFPDMSSPEPFLDWARTNGKDSGIPAALMPTRTRGGQPRPDVVPPDSQGVNVVGYFDAETGVGESARLLVTALEGAGIPVGVVPVTAPLARQLNSFNYASFGAGGHDVSIVAVNADEFPRFARSVDGELLDRSYTIGLWSWEVDVFPENMRASATLVDEIWVCSHHTAAAVAPAVDKPVHVFNLPVVAPPNPDLSRLELGLPDGPLFLYCFSFFSVVERKNPLGTIEAFCRAFEPGEGPTLVLKSIGGDAHRPELEKVRMAAAGRPDIVIIDGAVHRDVQNGIMHACDAYVSLHRAEGFGLTIAEAMAIGKPVVATAYSANLDYMTSDTGYLVPYELTQVPEGCPPYPTTASWATPDVAAASAALRSVWDDPASARATGARAAAAMRQFHSPEARSAFLSERIGAARRAGANGRGKRVFQTPDEMADRLVKAAPDIYTPTTYGAMSRFYRKVVGRAILHHSQHEARTAQALLDAQRHSAALLREKLDDEVAARLCDLEEMRRALAEIDDQWRLLHTRSDELASRVAELDDELSAEPYRSDPALLRTTDEKGRPVIGYVSREEVAASSGTPTFDSVFRGTEAFIRDRQRCYLALLEGKAPVVDLGCGRGEMLDLLAGAGIPAAGVDADPVMVARCRDKGHRVEHGDALAALSAHDDHSLGAVFSSQFIEHLAPVDVIRLLELALRKLRPGGLVIAETVNPHSPRALKAFWLDMTHRQPLFPEALVSRCYDLGFATGWILFPNGTGKLEVDRRQEGEYALVAIAPEG